MKKLLFFVFLFGIGNISGQQLDVKKLVCEYKENPVGIDIPQPRLSWQIQVAASEKNIVQSAYQIQVAQKIPSFTKSKNLVWNSGKVTSDQSVHVEYKGKKLLSKEGYFWRVKVWDNQGKESHWSDPAYWEMGILESKAWQAKWISPDLPEKEKAKNPAPMLRKEFKLKKKIKKARLYITSHGLYRATLNGKKVTEELFTPGWTSFNKRLQYQVFDVTNQVHPDQNTAGVILGDGWYRGRFGWANGWNLYGGTKLALLYQLEVEYTNGRREIIISDESWKASTGAIQFSSIYDGENYDARLEQKGWDQPGFEDNNWKGVIVADHSIEKLIAAAGVPVKKIKELKPVEILSTPEGETVVDFGQNLVGWVKVKTKGSKGDTLKLYHTEMLDKEGNFYTENLRSAKQLIQYVFKDDKEVVYEPTFTFQGFRYMKVENCKNISKDMFTAVVIHSDMEQSGWFECSDTLINQLQSNIQWGQRGNFLDVPTDCPQRDERMGWTGDAQAFAATATYNFNTGAFYTKWLGDVKADQNDNGSIPFVIPDVLKGNGSTGWGDVATILPWTMYLKYGDERILEEQYESMKAWVQFLHGLAGDNFLVQKGFHFGDWLFYLDPFSHNTKPGFTDIDFIATSFFAYSTDLVAKTAAVLGKTEDQKQYEQQFKAIKSAFQNEFVTKSGRLSPHSQTAYVLALNFNLLTEEQKPNAVNYLVENIEKRGFHLSTGFLGTPYLCHVLTENGKTDVAYKLLMQKTYPSWLYPVTKGATTIWERWDGLKPDDTFQDAGMNSFNHYAYGAIGDWMYSVVTGIKEDQEEPGYKHIIIKPEPDPVLGYAKAQHNSLYGPIKSSWKLENDKIKIEVTIPPNTNATLYLPNSDKDPVKLGSGSYSYEYPFGKE